MKIYFIRHGATKGNLEKRYIGWTDESLCTEGIAELKKLHLPDCDLLISSPLQRCVQSAKILFPEKQIHICEDFRECDFGVFENHNYQELNGNQFYQDWIDANGEISFPDGEHPADFKKRNIHAFAELISENHFQCMICIVHGGTIMSILEHYAVPKKSYYDYQISNAHGYLTEFDTHQQKLIILEKL